MDADILLTRRAPSTGLDADCARPPVAHCFEGWSGGARLIVERRCIELDSDLGRLVVCTGSGRYTVAIEPASHANLAVNLMARGGMPPQALGLEILQPGQSLTAQNEHPDQRSGLKAAAAGQTPVNMEGYGFRTATN